MDVREYLEDGTEKRKRSCGLVLVVCVRNSNFPCLHT